MRRAGTENHAAKLTDDKVRLIRYLYGIGATQIDLAALCNVGIAAIARITTRKGWRHVPDLIPVQRR